MLNFKSFFSLAVVVVAFGATACAPISEDPSFVADSITTTDAERDECADGSKGCPDSFIFYIEGTPGTLFGCNDPYAGAYQEHETKCYEYCEAGGCLGDVDDGRTIWNAEVRGADKGTTDPNDVVKSTTSCVEVYICKCYGNEKAALMCDEDEQNREPAMASLPEQSQRR